MQERRRKRILSLSKDQIVLQLRNAVMSMAGYRVSSPAQTEDALIMLAKERFALIVIGHTFSRKERRELIKRLRDANPNIPILSLYTSPDTMDRMADCEVNAQDGPEALLRAIHDCIGDPNGPTMIGKPER